MKSYQRNITGFSFIEALLAMALFLLLASGVALLAIHSLVVERQSIDYLKAVHFAEEGKEAVRFIRKAGYSEVEPIVDGGVAMNGQGELRLNYYPDVFEKFERRITVSDLDDVTKQVDVTVSWSEESDVPYSVTLTDLLYDWQRPY